MTTKELVKTNNERISEQVKTYTSEEVGIIKATIAKNFTDTELAYFLNVAKVYQLNPFTKQVWGYKDHQNNIIVFAGRDGFLAMAQRDQRWNGLSSDVVREGESFEMNAAEGIIKHKKDIASKNKILGAYALTKPRGCEYPTIEWADFDTYNKGHNVWKADPIAMIKKVAESHCLAKAYGISGLAIEEDFDTRNGVAYPIDHETKPSISSFGYAEELVRKSTLDDDQKEVIYDKLKDPEITSVEFDTIINNLKDAQPKIF